jgi:antitoxin MazE
MESRVAEVGGELMLVLPPEIAASAAISADSRVELSFENGAVVVRSATAPSYRLEDLLAQVTDANRHAETDWGPSVGREVW